MTIKLDGKVIYTSSSAIVDSRNIPVEFPGTIVGKEFEIIGPIAMGHWATFRLQGSLKKFERSENVFMLHSVYNSEFLGGSKLRVLIKYFHLFNLLF